MQHYDFRLSFLGPLQRCLQRIERIVRADRDEHVARLHADVFRRKFGRLRKIKLVELGVGFRPALGDFSEISKTGKKDNCEGRSRNRRDLLGKQIDNTQGKQGEGDQGHADGNLDACNVRFSGTLNSRSPGCLNRRTRTASPFIAKLHMTPKAYASPSINMLPRLRIIVRI